MIDNCFVSIEVLMLAEVKLNTTHFSGSCSPSVLWFFFKKHEINEETRSHQQGLQLDVQVLFERDPKVVDVGGVLLHKAGPLLADLPHLGQLVQRQHLEHDVRHARAVAQRAFDLQLGLSSLVQDGELGQDGMPVLLEVTDGVAWWALHLQLLEAAREAAQGAP